MSNGWFRPGDSIPVTGIYTVTHHEHRVSHDVVAAHGGKFPACRQCGDKVTFVLAHRSSHVDQDENFTHDPGG